tara:strand:+ start:771 stop:1214 length:444 start_codon:yes stop_codon:yes gene_type:complete
MKPKSVEVHPVYNCNECGSRHCEALEYVNRVGRIICGCGALLELDPIKTFKIHPVYKESVNKFELVNTKNKLDPINKININTNSRKGLKKEYANKCAELLVSLGWKKRESKKIVVQVFSLWNKEKNIPVTSRNFEDFITYLMSNQKC